jgi:hypothetical protein
VRGVLVRSVLVGQHYDLTAVPYTVPDPIWQILLERRAEFIEPRSLEGRRPWHDRDL